MGYVSQCNKLLLAESRADGRVRPLTAFIACMEACSQISLMLPGHRCAKKKGTNFAGCNW